MKFKFEIIHGDQISNSLISRAKVFGGWIVKSSFVGETTSESMVFMPDKDHEWLIDVID